MSFMKERTKSATGVPIRNAWTSSAVTSSPRRRPGTAIGTCRRVAFSATSPRPPQTERRMQPLRSRSAESLFIIPQAQSLESEFQAVLGKTLFEKSVNGAEEDIMSKGDSVIRWNEEPLSRSADNSPAMRRSGPPVFQYRTAITVKPTRCTTPLTNQNQTFRTYFPKGSLDINAVATAHGLVHQPCPNIKPQIHRIRSATHRNLLNFSLKQEYNDDVKETARERYWKRRAELKVLEDCIRMDVITELLAKADAEIARREKERAAAAKAAAERLAEIARIEAEKKRLEEERLARLIENCAQTDITYIEAIKIAENAPVKGKKKKGGKKKKSSSPSRGGKSSKTAKKKKKTPKGADDDYDVDKIPASILKDERLGSAGSGRRVKFREKLTSIKTIPSRSSSPKSSKRSSSPNGKKRGGKKGKGKGKKGKKKEDPVLIPVEPPKSEPAPEPEPVETPVEEPTETVIMQMDDPPGFILAEDYKTKNQLVEDWLHFKTCKAASKNSALIIDL